MSNKELTLEDLFERIDYYDKSKDTRHKRCFKQITTYLFWLYENKIPIQYSYGAGIKRKFGAKYLIKIEVEKPFFEEIKIPSVDDWERKDLLGRADLYLIWLYTPHTKQKIGDGCIDLYLKILESEQVPLSKEIFPLLTEIIEITSSPKSFRAKDKHKKYNKLANDFSVGVPSDRYLKIQKKYKRPKDYAPNRIWTWSRTQFICHCPEEEIENGNLMLDYPEESKEKKLPRPSKKILRKINSF